MRNGAVIINLYGGPGTGKSTMAARLQAELKEQHINSEYIGEFAKDLTWDESFKTLEDQLYVFANQYHRIHRCVNKVDFIISDSPLLLSLYYGKNEHWLFHELVIEKHRAHHTVDVLLERKDRPYNPVGRTQTHDRAKEMDDEIIQTIQNIGRPDVTQFDLTLPSEAASAEIILNYAKARLLSIRS